MGGPGHLVMPTSVEAEGQGFFLTGVILDCRNVCVYVFGGAGSSEIKDDSF